jgi:tetratricopeptide (TPR) repeat protein
VLDLVSALVSKSLVEAQVSDSATDLTRYRMLETIREYARERLEEQGDLARLSTRHAEYYTVLAERAAPELTTAHQLEWLGRLRADHANLQRALETSFEAGNVDTARRLAGALGRYWVVCGHWHTGRATYRRVLGTVEIESDEATALCLNWSGNLAKLQGDYLEARAQLERSLDIRRRLGEPTAIAIALNNLGNVVRDFREWDAAEALYRESRSIHASTGNTGGVALALNGLGAVAFLNGRLEEARSAYEESLRLRRSQGDRSAVAASLNNLATVEEATGNLSVALGLQDECLLILRELGDRSGIAAALNNLGRLARRAGEDERATGFYEESLRSFRELGNRVATASVLLNLADIAMDTRDEGQTRAQLAESLLTFQELGDARGIAESLWAFARLARLYDDPIRTAVLLSSWEGVCRSGETPMTAPAQSFLAETGEELRRSLGEETFERAWERGQRMDRDATILHALGGDTPGIP